MSQISTDMEFIPYKDITLGQVWQYAEEYCADHCGQLMVDDDCLYFMTENSDQTLASLIFDTGAEMSCQKTIQHIMSLVGLDIAGRSMALMSSNSLVAAADTLQSLHSNLITNATLNTAFMINKADKEIIQLQQHRTASMLKSLYLVMSRNISNMSRSNFKEAEIFARYLVEASDFFVAARNTIVLSLQTDFNMNKLLLLKEELEEEDNTSYAISKMKKPSVDFSDYPDVMFRNSNFNFMMLHMLLQTNLLCMVYEGKIYSGITMNELSQVTSSDMAMLRQQMMGDELMGGAPLKDEARKELLRTYKQYPDTIKLLVLTTNERDFLKGSIVNERTAAQKAGNADLVSVLNSSFAAVNNLTTVPEKNRVAADQFPKIGAAPQAPAPQGDEGAAAQAAAQASAQAAAQNAAAQAAADKAAADAAAQAAADAAAAEELRKEAEAQRQAAEDAKKAAEIAAKFGADSAAAKLAKQAAEASQRAKEAQEELVKKAIATANVQKQGGNYNTGFINGLSGLFGILNPANLLNSVVNAFNAARDRVNGLFGTATSLRQQLADLLGRQDENDLVAMAEKLNLSPEIIATLRQQSYQKSDINSVVAEAKKLKLSESVIAQLEAQQAPQITPRTDIAAIKAEFKLAKDLGLSEGFLQSYQARLS